MNEKKEEILRKKSFWEHLTEIQKELLLRESRIVRYQAGDSIYSSVRECLGAVFILEGIMRTYLLSDEGKEVTIYRLREAAQGGFEHPNNLLLCATASLEARPFGIPDERFAHLNGRARMITKAPVRLLTLQALELNRRRVFWDVGFCTGSVSIEARLQFPHLTVVSFEVRAEGEELMNINSRRFGTPGITAITGDFLQTATDALPRPDAVFIGGHGGRLPEMLAKIKENLQPGGCIVFNSVSADSKNAFTKGAEAAGLIPHPSVRIALNDYNPIEIMKATLS